MLLMPNITTSQFLLELEDNFNRALNRFYRILPDDEYDELDFDCVRETNLSEASGLHIAQTTTSVQEIQLINICHSMTLIKEYLDNMSQTDTCEHDSLKLFNTQITLTISIINAMIIRMQLDELTEKTLNLDLDFCISKFAKDNIKSCLDTAKKKNADYAGDADPFKNFKTCSAIGINVEDGILTRILDKVSRVATLIKADDIKVKSESILDTCFDMMNYFAILQAYVNTKPCNRNN